MKVKQSPVITKSQSQKARMLPLIGLPTDCLLAFEKGRLKNGEERVLNPFAYSTVTSVLTWLTNSREWAFPVIGSAEQRDFFEFVLDVDLSKLEVIQSVADGGSLTNTVVVPRLGKDPVWLCTDGVHLSYIERVQNTVTATPVLLSAPFEDLVAWFRDANSKISTARKVEWVKGLPARSVEWVKAAKAANRAKFTDAWAQELWVEPTDNRVYAHTQFRKETVSWTSGLLDLGVASLQGVEEMGIPGASEFTKAVLSKYVTAKAGCFESLQTALSRVKADVGDTAHVAGMLRKRACVVEAHWRTLSIEGKLLLHVVLENPVRTVHSNLHFLRCLLGRTNTTAYRRPLKLKQRGYPLLGSPFRPEGNPPGCSLGCRKPTWVLAKGYAVPEAQASKSGCFSINNSN